MSKQQKFKNGDRVRVKDDGYSMWAGICGTVVNVDHDRWIVIHPDEGSRYTDGSPILDGYRECATMNPNNLELIDTTTPPQEAKKFKIGDRVRIINDKGWNGVCGTVIGLSNDEFSDEERPILRPDAGSHYADGSPLRYYYKDNAGSWSPDNLELIDTATPTFHDWQLTTLSHRQRSNDPTAPLMTLTLKGNSFAEIKAAFLSAADVLGYGEA